MTQPASASDPPITSASSTRGRRMVSQIWRSVSSLPLHSTFTGRRNAPKPVAMNVMTVSNPARIHNDNVMRRDIRAVAPLWHAAVVWLSACGR
ncbi:Uncharacterised protein [Enterobacter cloacae]|nr:Uncharacterised protein [Enterobacter cloacae]